MQMSKGVRKIVETYQAEDTVFATERTPLEARHAKLHAVIRGKPYLLVPLAKKFVEAIAARVYLRKCQSVGR